MKPLFVLFLKAFGIVFAGLVLVNICAVFVRCIFGGFAMFASQLADLPYVIYLVFSLIFSVVLALIIYRKAG